MSKAPFMPLWVSDFIGDTLDLDTTEIGAYMLILMAQWNRDGRSIPNDDKLKKVARCGRNWPRVWGNIERFFSTDENGIFSKRLRLESTNVALKRQVNARNGALGGKAKSLLRKDVAIANAKNSPQRIATIPEPEPYIKKEDTKVSLSPDADIEIAFSAYNVSAKEAGWPSAVILSKHRISGIKARLKDCGGIDGWHDALAKARASPHCCGQNDRGWTADLDFLLKQKSFTRLMEGSYDDRTIKSTSNSIKSARGSGRSVFDEIANAARS